MGNKEQKLFGTLASGSIFQINELYRCKMNNHHDEKGFTLIELLLAISLVSILFASIIPTFIEFRKRESNWRAQIQMEQEAIRFFTYFENRNAGAKSWRIRNESVVIESSERRANKPITRLFYLDGSRIVETDIERGGFLILAQNVDSVHFQLINEALHIQLTLTDGKRTYKAMGILSRSLD